VIYCEVKAKKHIAASATDYSMNILTGSRLDVKLESKADGKPSLYDIFYYSEKTPAASTNSQAAQTAQAVGTLSSLQSKLLGANK
jgi:hypothetical protein